GPFPPRCRQGCEELRSREGWRARGSRVARRTSGTEEAARPARSETDSSERPGTRRSRGVHPNRIAGRARERRQSLSARTGTRPEWTAGDELRSLSIKTAYARPGADPDHL